MGNPEVLAPEPAAGVRWDIDVDIVVVGGALAGFTTALHAHELGASVVVLEKAAEVGGTARKAVAGMWVPNNRFMQQAGTADGGKVTVATARGSLTLPVEVAVMPDRVVWLPTRSAGSEVRRELAAGHGSLVTLRSAE